MQQSASHFGYSARSAQLYVWRTTPHPAREDSAMPNILTVTSSILGEASISNRLVRHTVDELRRTEPASNVVTRDLGPAPLPHLTVHAAAALRAEPATRRQRAARGLSGGLLAGLTAAGTLASGAPMHNFGTPTTLKAWFDHVLRAGVT